MDVYNPMIKNKENALETLDALQRLMYKNGENDLSILNLLQMLKLELESAHDARVNYGKSDMSIMFPINTLGGRYNLLLTIALDKVE